MAAKRGAFEEWYAQQYDEWWKDEKKAIRRAWNDLEELGVPTDVIAGAFSTVVRAVRNQYGD